MIVAGRGTRCRICDQPLSDLESRKRRIGPDCWKRLNPAQKAKFLALAAREADPHYIPPARKPSAVAQANNAEVRRLAGGEAPQFCARHDRPAGSCVQCRKERDEIAARIIWDIQQDRIAIREQAWQDRVSEALELADA